MMDKNQVKGLQENTKKIKKDFKASNKEKQWSKLINMLTYKVLKMGLKKWT